MKTIIDAVNEFKGRSVDCCFFSESKKGIMGINYRHGSKIEGGEVFICTVRDYDNCVTSLSHFKGEELFKEYLAADKTPLGYDKSDYAKGKQADYTSEEFWKDASEGYNAFMPESDDWHASWLEVDGDDVKRVVRRGYSEESEAGGYSVKTLLSEGLVLRPQPKPVKPVYTQAMFDNGEFPPVGAECMVLDLDCNDYYNKVTIDFIGERFITYTIHQGMLSGEYSQVRNRLKVIPIDARTSEEKAIDDIKKILDCDKFIAENLFHSLGEIHGVTFKGEE